MKALSTFIVLSAFVTTASAQVDTSGLVSEAPGSASPCYIVSYNGYYLTSKGSEVITSAIAPDYPEWVIEPTDGGYTISNGSRRLTWAEGGAGIVLSSTPQKWDVTTNNTEAADHYTISADIAVDFYGTIMEDYDGITITNDGTIYPWPATWEMSIAEDGMTRDFLFFTQLPEQIDNRSERGGEGEEEDDVIEVPENTIEGDFLANWELGLQDAKVLAYVPMNPEKMRLYDWMPQRSGVRKRESTIFTEDVVAQFRGNTIKNVYFVMPPNAKKFEVFVRDANNSDIYGGFLYHKEFDYSDAVNYMLAQPTGKYNDSYGTSLNTDLLAGTDYDYYVRDVITAFPVDVKIGDEISNLEIGYFITYPGEYKDNYKNGKDYKGGLYDGIWYCENALLPTTRSEYALIQGSDDADFNRPMDDYTDYQSILKEEYRWCEYAGLFCFAETEGEGGFPHNDLRFNEVKTIRCNTGEVKVPFQATFTNYGVDPIITANIDVKIGDNVRTLKYKDGIGFLEQGIIDEDVVAPSDPVRTDMSLTVSKINGKEVNLTTSINGSIIAVNKAEQVQRMPVIEENTGTWCGWCPRGIVGMEKMRQEYGEDIALIAIHTGVDQKTNGMMDEVLGTFGATGAPSCVINRLRTGDPYSGTNGRRYGILEDVEAMRSLITEATVSIDAAVISADGDHVGLRTSTTFAVDSETCPYLLTYVLTEDGLKYATQANYYKTQTDAETTAYYKTNMPELYELTQKPNPWAPTYNDVMEYCSDAMGTKGTLSAPIVRGEAQQTEYVIEVPKYTNGKSLVTNLRNCRAIVLLLDRESLEVVNAAQVRLADAPVATDGDDIFAGIGTVLSDAPAAATQRYDLSGRALVGKDVSGVMIQNGRKVIR